MSIVPIKQVGQIGLNKDLSQSELPINAWTDAQNIRFLDGIAQQFLGHSAVYNTPAYAPQYVMPCNVSSQRYWIYTTATKTFCVTNTGGSTVHTDITHVTPRTGVVNNWTGTMLSGVPILNAGNATSYPMAWNLNTANKFVDLTNWPANYYCKAIRSFKNYVIALNITKTATNYPYMIKWSHPADPGSLPSSWDHTDATKNAGEFDIAEGYDAIVDGMQLGDSFMIYKENSIWRMDFTGGVNIFQFRKVLGKSGAMNRNCIADIDGFHVVLTSNDVITHDGNNPKSILDKATRRWLFNNIDETNQNLCFLTANPYYNEVFICFPTIGSTVCNKAIVYNYKDNTCSTRDLPSVNHAAYGPVDNSLSNSWGANSDSWANQLRSWNGPAPVPSNARCILASSDLNLYMIDASASFNGTNPTSYLERRGLSFDYPDYIKLVKSIRPRISGTAGSTISIYVAGTDDPWETPTYGPAMTHTIGTTVKNDCLVSGRYISIMFASDSAPTWNLHSYDVELQNGGLY